MEGAVDQLHRVDRRHALGGEVHRAAGVGAGDDVGRGPLDRAELARCGSGRPVRVGRSSTPRRRRSTARRRRARRARARTGPARSGSPGARAARGAGGTDPAPRRAGRAAPPAGSRSTCSASHSWMSKTRSENRAAVVGPQQVAVVLHGRAAARRVDDDRQVGFQPLDHPLGERPCVVGEPGVGVQRAAARRPSAR